MITTKEGKLLLTTLNMSESVSEESAASKPPPPKNNLMSGLLKQDQVLRMMNRESCH